MLYISHVFFYSFLVSPAKALSKALNPLLAMSSAHCGQLLLWFLVHRTHSCLQLVSLMSIVTAD